MSESIDDVLAEADDEKLCGKVFDRLIAHHGNEIDLSRESEEERVVTLVSHVTGIIGNGGFRYLLEGNIPGDPYLSLTAQAFEVIGCEKAVRAFRETLALFPDGRSQQDIGARLQHYLKQVNWPTPQDHLFFEADDDIWACLARYIRAHAGAYRHLHKVRAPYEPPEPAEQEPSEQPSRQNPLDDLPHWKRVAFAARCARRVLPLLARYWPDIPYRYAQAPLRAIEVAERSAAAETSEPDLRGAILQAVITAGAALANQPGYPEGDEDPKPRNAFEGTIASKVAKAAEHAALAAETAADESAGPALQAWWWAQQAASMAEDEEMIATLDRVLAQVQPVPDELAAVFDAEESPLVRRGRRLFLAFAVPLVLIEFLSIAVALTGDWDKIRWWRSVGFPCGTLVMFWFLWKGDPLIRWVAPLCLLVSGGTNLFLSGYVTVRLAQVTPPAFAGIFARIFGAILGALTLLGLLNVAAALVFLFAPSVRAFFRHQQETSGEME
jgi:hypothetical protein